MSLAERISAETPPLRAVHVRVPKGFDEPGTADYISRSGTVMTSAPIASEDYRAVFERDTGLPVPEGLDVVLERATVQRLARSDTAFQYWYKFKFVPRLVTPEDERPSIFALEREAKKAKAPGVIRTREAAGAAVINIADLQLGKTDRHGGTPETVKGFHAGMDLALDYIARHRPEQIVLTELGDGAENFQNTPTQAQTNDLQLIEQLDLHTELLAYAAMTLAKKTRRLTVVGVPSNHMEVREDGKAVGGVHNDYGLLSLSNVRRVLRANDKAFGHVGFAWPQDHEVSLTLDIAGMPVGFAHGHYTRGNANQVEKWLAGQFAGNHPLQPARIIFTAHFHHLRVQNIIGGRWWFQAPTLDRGSSWLERSSGEGGSQNGILALMVAASGWDHLELLKTH